MARLLIRSLRRRAVRDSGDTENTLYVPSSLFHITDVAEGSEILTSPADESAVYHAAETEKKTRPVFPKRKK